MYVCMCCFCYWPLGSRFSTSINMRTCAISWLIAKMNTKPGCHDTDRGQPKSPTQKETCIRPTVSTKHPANTHCCDLLVKVWLEQFVTLNTTKICQSCCAMLIAVVIHDGTLLVIFMPILCKKLHPQRGLKKILHLIAVFVNHTKFALINFDDLSEKKNSTFLHRI